MVYRYFVSDLFMVGSPSPGKPLIYMGNATLVSGQAAELVRPATGPMAGRHSRLNAAQQHD
jgi:hypothetical protein